MMHFTHSGVRLVESSRRAGDLNWLFLPGGPGIGSESVAGLVDLLELRGTSWLVDLPGDGSNIDGPGISESPFRRWPNVLAEAAGAVPNPVFVGHSTGGMYLLATPELEEIIVGLVLISTAPDASWLQFFVQMTEQNPLPQGRHGRTRHRWCNCFALRRRTASSRPGRRPQLRRTSTTSAGRSAMG